MGFVHDKDVKATVILPEAEKKDDSDVKEGWNRIILE